MMLGLPDVDRYQLFCQLIDRERHVVQNNFRGSDMKGDAWSLPPSFLINRLRYRKALSFPVQRRLLR